MAFCLPVLLSIPATILGFLGLGAARQGGGAFHAALVNGEFRFVPATVSDATLRRAVTFDDREPLGPDW